MGINKVFKNKVVSYNYMMIIMISIVSLMVSLIKVPLHSQEIRDIIFDNYQIYMVYLVIYLLFGVLVAKKVCKTVLIFLLFGYYYSLFLLVTLTFLGLIGFAMLNPIVLFVVIGNTFIYLIIFFIVACIQQLIVEKYFCNYENKKVDKEIE
jgi:hypothetical protein